jgi:hypothetical protein
VIGERTAESTALHENVAIKPWQSSFVVTDPQPSQCVGEETAAQRTQRGPAESGPDQRFGATVSLSGGHECEASDESGGFNVEIEVDR